MFMAEDFSKIIRSVQRWRSAILHQLQSMAGANPSDWLKIIETSDKFDILPKSYAQYFKDQPSSIPLRTLLGIFETVKRIKKPGGHPFSALLKADEILIELYSMKDSRSKPTAAVKKLHEEAEEWLRNAIGFVPVAEADAENAGSEKAIFDDLRKGNTFMAVYAKHVTRLKMGQGAEETMEDEQDLRQFMARLRAKGELELDGFWNNRKTLQKTLRQVLQCSICNQFSQTLQTRLPCLHLICEPCLSRQPQCPLCPSSVISRISDDSRSPAATVSYVTNGLVKLHDLCSGPNESFECSLCVQLADKFCLDCGSLYCDDHGRQLYHNDSHKILGAVELLDSQAIQGLLFEFCPLHKRPLKHFCAHCQACMCTHPSCTSAHLDHLQYAPSLEDTKSWLYGDTIRLRSVLKTKLGRVHSRMKVVQRNEIRVADEQELIKEAILTDFNVLTAVLADAKERFLHDLDEAVKKCLEEAEASKNVLGTWIDQFENLDAQLRFLNNHLAWSRLATFSKAALRLTLDSTEGYQLLGFDTVVFDTTPTELFQAVTTLQSDIAASDSEDHKWLPLLALDSDILVFRFCQDNLYLCQPSGLFGQYQLSLYNVTDLSHAIAKAVLNDGSMVSVGDLAADSQTAKVYVATWRRKFELSLSKGNVPYLIIDQYSTYLEKEKTFVLDWLRQQHTNQLVHLEAYNSLVYVNDGDAIHELSSTGQVTRTMSFQGALQIEGYLLDFDISTAFAFDFKGRKTASYDWMSQLLTYGQMDLDMTKVSALSRDDFGHFFLLDDTRRMVVILDRQYAVLSTVSLPSTSTEKTERKRSTTVEQLLSKLKAAGTSETRLAMELTDGCIHISEGGTIFKMSYL